MYGRDIWDSVYKKHKNDAPWLTDVCCEIYSEIIGKYLPEDIVGMHLLDYGCGNGKIAAKLCEKGIQYDLAEISHLMIEYLHYTYPSINVYEVDYPQQIHPSTPYDFIITWMLFCNIVPDFWSAFLKGFYELLKPGGELLIGGWDEEDPINIRNHNIVLFTERQMWPINTLYKHIDKNKFEIFVNEELRIKLPFYSEARAIRCYLLKKTNFVK